MTHRSRWAFSHLARVAAAVAAVAVFGAGSLLAQGTTGKIEGTVKDSAGAPIGGATVMIVGTAFRSRVPAMALRRVFAVLVAAVAGLLLASRLGA